MSRMHFAISVDSQCAVVLRCHSSRGSSTRENIGTASLGDQCLSSILQQCRIGRFPFDSHDAINNVCGTQNGGTDSTRCSHATVRRKDRFTILQLCFGLFGRHLMGARLCKPAAPTTRFRGRNVRNAWQSDGQLPLDKHASCKFPCFKAAIVAPCLRCRGWKMHGTHGSCKGPGEKRAKKQKGVYMQRNSSNPA